MTDPLGKHWSQPPRENIEIDETHALMSVETFGALKEYSHSIPTGVYPGKMWRMWWEGDWFLCWFGISPDPAFCTKNRRRILVA